jgi:hypothetical protein
MRVFGLGPFLAGVVAAAVCVAVAPSARAQDPAPDETKEKPAGEGGETPPPEDKPKDELGGWGVGGTEQEGKFKPTGKTGKLKELEQEKEEERQRDEEPADLGPPGIGYVDFANTPKGTIVVPVQDAGPTTIKPGASFLIGISYRILNKWEVGARFGVSSAASDGPRKELLAGSRDPDAYKQIATGNLEIGARYFFQLTQSVVLPAGLSLVIPTATGDMFADPDNRADIARAIVNQAADAMRGWEDRSLWAPKHFGIVPNVAVAWQRGVGPGKIKVTGRTKVDIMVKTGGVDPDCVSSDLGGGCTPFSTSTKGAKPDAAVAWLLGGGVGYALFDGLLEPELKLWLTYSTATESFGSFKVQGAQFVFEPNVRTHVPFTKDKGVGLDARFGFTLPAGGPLGSNSIFSTGSPTNIWGLRLTAGIFF